MWYWIVRKIVNTMSARNREKLACDLVRDEVIGHVAAEIIIAEVIKDQNNKVISFIVKD